VTDGCYSPELATTSALFGLHLSLCFPIDPFQAEGQSKGFGAYGADAAVILRQSLIDAADRGVARDALVDSVRRVVAERALPSTVARRYAFDQRSENEPAQFQVTEVP
jgi:hypothetical protein